jgi:two-component system NarL family sensor kinase
VTFDAVLILDDERVVAASPSAREVLGADPAGLSRADFAAARLHVTAPDGTRRRFEFSFVADFLPGRHLAIVRASPDRLIVEALDAEDRARERISQELHDELLQSLLAVRQDLAEIVAGHGGAGRPRIPERALAGVERAIGSLRAVVFDLHPIVLRQGGLRKAVGAVVEHHARLAGLAAEVDVGGDAQTPHARLALSLVRELMSNVTRHAAARHVSVRVRCERERLWLEVSDDGRGMDPGAVQDAVARGHIGLASAIHRVEALGGEVRFSGGPGQGTTVRVEIPAAVPG